MDIAICSYDSQLMLIGVSVAGVGLELLAVSVSENRWSMSVSQSVGQTDNNY